MDRCNFCENSSISRYLVFPNMVSSPQKKRFHPFEILKILSMSALRLLEFVGTGRTSVNHARGLAQIYDSDIITSLGCAKKTVHFHTDNEQEFSICKKNKHIPDRNLFGFCLKIESAKF